MTRTVFVLRFAVFEFLSFQIISVCIRKYILQLVKFKHMSANNSRGRGVKNRGGGRGSNKSSGGRSTGGYQSGAGGFGAPYNGGSRSWIIIIELESYN